MTNNNYRIRQKSVVLLGVMCVFSISAMYLSRPPHSGNKTLNMPFMPSTDVIQESPYGHRILRIRLKSFIDPKIVKQVARDTAAENLLKPQLALPNILFLGAQKAGSTSVSSWLFSEGVCRAKIFPGEPPYFAKEVHFFDKSIRYDQGVEFYAERFQHCLDSGNTEFIMDATPDYLTFPEQISDAYTNAGADALSRLKLIVVLREPMSRELSLYNHMIAFANDNTMTFEQHASLVLKGKPNPHWTSTGKYVDHLKKFASFISREQLLVLSYDELKTDPERAQWRIQQFLGREFPGELPTLNLHENPNKLRVVSPRARQVLEPFFKDKNEELYEFLERNPGPWMEQRPFPHFHLE